MFFKARLRARFFDVHHRSFTAGIGGLGARTCADHSGNLYGSTSSFSLEASNDGLADCLLTQGRGIVGEFPKAYQRIN